MNNNKKKYARRSISQGLIAHVYAQKQKNLNVLTETVPVLLNKLNSPHYFVVVAVVFPSVYFSLKRCVFWGVVH